MQLYSHEGISRELFASHGYHRLSFATILLSPLGVTARRFNDRAQSISASMIFQQSSINLSEKGLWSNQKLTSQKTSLCFLPADCRNRPKTTTWERCQHCQFEPRTKISLWSMIWIKMSVTSTIIHWMHNWKLYHSIDLAKSFLLNCRCWTFTKVTTNTFMRSSERLAHHYLRHHGETYPLEAYLYISSLILD